MPQLVIACARPGLIRGGVRHPKTAVHLLHDFTPDQLREMLDEPELALVIGRPLTFADVAALEAGAFVHADEEAKASTDGTDGTDEISAEQEAMASASVASVDDPVSADAESGGLKPTLRAETGNPAKRRAGRAH